MFSSTLLDLSLKGVVSNIPHDAGSVVAYSVLLLFVGVIWLGSRRKKEPS